MCGIVGTLYGDGREVCPGQLHAMINMIRHRGPDAAAVYTDGQAGLAHARLSVIDLENGRQPMATADGRFVITFNGEIYNYVELRETLSARGHHFRTQSDTEVVLQAFVEYGEQCVERFNGQWAFAIWDRAERRLFLSRDRFGIRPLVYTMAGGGFLFGSEIKSLFAHPDVPRQLDPRGLNQLLTYWAPLAPTTLFRGVMELPPAHNMTVDAALRVQSYAYWSLDYEPDSSFRSADQWAEQLREVLTEATRLRLRADVPVGAYVSGGVDSAITTALAQQFTGDRLKTFSVKFEDSTFDESPHQRAVVEALGVEHHALHCSYDDIARVFPDVVWHAEKPLFRTAPAPLQLLAELVRASGFKVVLTGEGADEILGGYDLFKEAKVRRFCAAQPGSALRTSLIGQLYPYLPAMQSQSVALRQAFFDKQGGDPSHPFYSHLPRWANSAPLRRFLHSELQHELQHDPDYREVTERLPDDFLGWRPFCQAQHLETSILLPGYILSTQGDRMAMAHSVEGRFPFLDHHVAEFAAKLPPRLKMKGMNEKYLLKRTFADLVPEQVVRRPKQPYRAPDAQSFFTRDWQSARADYVREVLSPERVERAGVFQPAAVAGLMRKLHSGKATGTRDNMAFVAILSTQLLVEKFIEHFPPRDVTPGSLYEADTGLELFEQSITS